MREDGRVSTPTGKGTAAGQVKIALLGAGHGGLALAGDLGLMGFEVTLFSFFPAELAPVRDRGGVELSGEITGFGRIARVVESLAEALDGADLVLIVATAVAHQTYASLLAVTLPDGQTVVMNPGRNCSGRDVDRDV